MSFYTVKTRTVIEATHTDVEAESREDAMEAVKTAWENGELDGADFSLDSDSALLTPKSATRQCGDCSRAISESADKCPRCRANSKN